MKYFEALEIKNKCKFVYDYVGVWHCGVSIKNGSYCIEINIDSSFKEENKEEIKNKIKELGTEEVNFWKNTIKNPSGLPPIIPKEDKPKEVKIDDKK